MQYRHERGQSEPAGTSKLAKRRTVETNKMKRLMYNRSVRGAIWARQYLLKASKAKLEVSTATKARLAGACPKYRPIIHRSLSLQWLQFLASKRASLTGACPIPCLYCIGAFLINEHSPSLRRGEAIESIPTFQTYSPWQILIFFLYIFSSSFEGYPQFLALFLKNHARGRKGSSKSKKNRRIRKAVSWKNSSGIMLIIRLRAGSKLQFPWEKKSRWNCVKAWSKFWLA